MTLPLPPPAGPSQRAQVREFAATHPRNTLLEFAIEDEPTEVGAQLEAATGIRAACWGHANCRSSCDYWDELADRDTAQRAFGSEREEQRGQLDVHPP